MLPNAGGYVNDSTYDSGTDTNNWWVRLAPYCSGLMNEYWMQEGNNIDTLTFQNPLTITLAGPAGLTSGMFTAGRHDLLFDLLDVLQGRPKIEMDPADPIAGLR